jgi:D-tyrosyl-tRNA(Tyr) deacylase
MTGGRRAVYFFCNDPRKDPVAHHVFESLMELQSPEEVALVIDGHVVLRVADGRENWVYFVQTDEVLSHRYERYLPAIRAEFATFDFAGIVNWHAGGKCPEAILTVHTMGDVPSGYFCPAHPVLMSNLLLSLERNRRTLGLESFTTTSEATHWSGVLCGGAPELLLECPVPLVDIEIGSNCTSWSNPVAARVMARSLLEVFGDGSAPARSVLCVGGMHFEPAFSNAILETHSDLRVVVSHILASRWMMAGAYDSEMGLGKLEACIRSIVGGVQGVMFHDSLQSAYKRQMQIVGSRLSIPVFNHRKLRRTQVQDLMP